MDKQAYYPQLDSIRGLSFLGIFLFHSIHPEFDTNLLGKFGNYIFNQLPLAIDVFFLLSSFLLTRIGLTEYKKKQNFSFTNYFLRRALRIWPLYYLLMLFSFVLFPAIADRLGYSFTLPDYRYYIFFVSNFYHVDHVFFLRILWTLSVEEQFYLILGIVLKRFKFILIWIFLLFIAVSIGFSLYSTNTSEQGYFHTLTYFFDFAVGGTAAYLLSVNSKKIKWLRNLTGRSKYFFYSYLPVHFIIFFSIETMQLGGLWDDLISRYLFCVYISFLMVEQLSNANRSIVLENSRFLRLTGKISYGLYCFHGITITGSGLIVAHFQFGISQYLMALIVFCINYFLAFISYNFFEKPFLDLKNRLRRA
jgi:peptidoglycan/LPS O-acetylase OafA/YrhL